MDEKDSFRKILINDILYYLCFKCNRYKSISFTYMKINKNHLDKKQMKSLVFDQSFNFFRFLLIFKEFPL